ncbi:MAG: response regulator SirA [Planctomycetes bacterium]|jgi:uridine kinase|nr:response regulator SirA [Planctomycetota bacterium]HNZ65798.1 ATP cone domain-containing protein [Planctomycetota bacterium]HPY75666.1 ATP cone domain-containing protein [Planctomycetota bacterium]HQB01215.1 ATP cone domain-containing protein [Planctomycetota bacterium]
MAILQILKRNGKIVAFERIKIFNAILKAANASEMQDKETYSKLTEEVCEHLEKNFPDATSIPSIQDATSILPSVEDIQDIVEETLIRNNLSAIAKSYILYRNERKKQRESESKSDFQHDIIPYKKLWEILNWNIEHNCESVEKLNHHIRTGSIQQLILDAEEAYNQDIERAAQSILERKDEIKLVIIAGPSSSGKTTTTIKLAEHLRKQDVDLIALNIDNYFFNLDCHPQDEFGDYDFETPEALDLKLINQHLRQLLDYEPIQSPRYNFKTGKREETTDTFQLKKNQIILIDTLHGLHPPMTESVSSHNKFRLYIETLSQLKDLNREYTRWTDIRLLRRMMRDHRQRSYNPKMTIEHWHYVRKSEFKHIFPYLPTVDYIVNGALCYELPVFKKYMFQYFPNFIKEYENNAARQDAYIRAKRIYELLKTMEDFDKDEEWIPKDSHLREFIGGSCYTYHI